MEVDHIYICTDYKAPVGDLLKEFGLIEGTSNIHPGQGTANRRFFFHNFMLELLWIENLKEVKSDLTKPMRLFERCSKKDKNISPFGIGFRPTTEKDEKALFPVWDYHPIYLPDFLKIQVADSTPLSEPMFFYLSFAGRQDKYPLEKLENMKHKLPLKEVTEVKMHINKKENFSEAAEIINKTNSLILIKDNENYLELTFDNHILKKKISDLIFH
ncbi:hypothetical protein [Fusobacterium ulcerans]|uniref:Glyoxalase-like domain-containing protein n=1 Tax=Fusobacterium ulcerans 12-1B TaxID=457404 RepID=H1PYE3_9FUSO|nr:hypothetical protein [Fusobacterium ulcerans]EHO77443.1 hypothetical protein HMPREF0402_03436 [Fusobacterium ulcerans 12-1B]